MQEKTHYCGVWWNIVEYGRILWNMVEYCGIFHEIHHIGCSLLLNYFLGLPISSDIPQYSAIFHNIPQYSAIFHNIPWNINILWISRIPYEEKTPFALLNYSPTKSMNLDLAHSQTKLKPTQGVPHTTIS